MPLFAASLLAAALASHGHPDPICAIGRQVLADLPGLVAGSREPSFHDVDDALTRAYPALARTPIGLPPADADAHARASVHAPVPGPPIAVAYVYRVDLPVLAGDGQGATVRINYDCTGLCGGSYGLRCARTANGWRYVEQVGPINVS